MRLRSTLKNIFYLLLFFVFCALMTNLAVGLCKQIIAQKRMNIHLEEKKVQLKQLEEENQKLKAQLSEVEDPDFLNQETKRLFGLTGAEEPGPKEAFFNPEPEAKNQLLTPNWQKWLNLFNF